jgi:hypothetical protein
MSDKETKEVDVEELTDAQLRELADKEAKEIAEKATTEETKDEVVEEKPEVFRKEIDLGDGSGVQVFEGADWKEVAEKLATAQMHATKKIREQNKVIKVEKTVEKAVEQELTADEEYLLSLEMQNHPGKTQKKLLEQTFGMPLAEIKATLARAKELELTQRAEAAANEFVQKHDEFYPCPKNGAKIQAYMRTHGLEPSVENLEKAFEDLSESGLLEAKPEEVETEVSAESETAEHQESSRIVKTETKPVVTQRRVGSGLSSRGRAATAVKSTEPTLDELYEMPLHKLEELARKAGR